MKTSAKGVLEIAEHEGVVPAPYLDSTGVWTWGVGHTAAAGGPDPAALPRGMPDDVERAVQDVLAQFRQDLIRYEDRVNRAITVPIPQHAFDALVSFDFNTGGIFRAKLTKAINDGDPDASRHFMGWLKPPEIRKRRTAEKRLFETGDYDANGDAIPIWRVDGAGRLRGVLRNLTPEEMARFTGPAPTAPAPIPRPDASGQTSLLSRILAAILRFLKSGKAPK